MNALGAILHDISERFPSLVLDWPDGQASNRVGPCSHVEIYANVGPCFNGMALRHICAIKVKDNLVAVAPGDLARSISQLEAVWRFDLADPEKLDEFVDIIRRCVAAAAA